MFKYLLVREDVSQNQWFDTLAEARDYQRLCPANEASGILRVMTFGRGVSMLSGVKVSYASDDATGFLLLNLE